MGKNLNRIMGVSVWMLLLGVILSPTAFAFTASDLANGWTWYGENGAVLTTWEPYSGTEASRLIGAEIWRDFEIRDVILQGEDEFESGYWIDASEPAGIRVVDITIDQVTGVVSYHRRFIAWQPEEDEEGNLDPTWEEFLADNEDILGIDWTMTSIHYGWVPEGPVIGRLQIYRIRPILLVQYHASPSVYLWRLTQGELSTTNNLVVPVGPPFLMDAQVSGTIATCEVNATFGTDETIIQVARDPGTGANLANLFLPERTYSEVSVVNPFDPDGNQVMVEIDLSQVPGSGNVFWWRAGSRNRRSTYQPRPWPLSDPDYGWVWSDMEWMSVGFSDASPGHWAFSEIEALRQAGIVEGYPDGTYQPTIPVTRDSMAVYTARAMAGSDANVPDEESYPTPSFGDVPVNYWAYQYIEYAVDAEVVRGYDDGLYHPEETVDRSQMAVYVARARGWVDLDEDMTTAPALFPDVPAGFWAGTAIEVCLENDVVRGYPDGYYRPEETVTRDQMAVYISRAFLE